MGYVHLTNTVAKAVLKTNKFHIYFKSYGHKVHRDCFYKYYEQQANSKAFRASSA